MIIVFEGLDNAGKTTLAEKLEVSLIKDGYDVNYTREFQTPVGLLIKELYGQGKMDATMKSYLFAADRHMRLWSFLMISDWRFLMIPKNGHFCGLGSRCRVRQDAA